MLEVKDIQIGFQKEEQWRTIVDTVSFKVERGKTLGIVGESGSGKSLTALSITRLLPHPLAKFLGGEVLFNDQDLLKCSPQQIRAIRGKEIGFVFQEPMTALNPLHKIGRQVMESLLLHLNINKSEAREIAINLLKMVGFTEVIRLFERYPHELSGGQRQRIVIAIALSCKPSLLIADEPTTALDANTQASILALLKEFQVNNHMAMLFISHDLNLVIRWCDEIIVMYAGRVVEKAPAAVLATQARHPYTRGLFASALSSATTIKQKMPTIAGQIVASEHWVTGCRFCQRLGLAPQIEKTRMNQVDENHWFDYCPGCHTYNFD